MAEVQFWLPEGTITGGRYRLDKVLGVGGYGITYKGVDTRLDRVVAVKEYYPSFWVSRYSERGKEVNCMRDAWESYEKGMERFLDEAKTLASLSDVLEVVRVNDFFEENNTAYLVMDFLDGQNLKQMADGFGGRIPPDVLIPVLEPLIKALGKIHQKGLIHRDISPDNIMMLEDGTTRLIDFGNARDTTNNKSMTLAMKQGFAAPEQYKSRGQGTFTDVYGICATMYYCITGKLPPQAMERLMGTPFPKPSELGINIHPVWEQTIMEGLDLFVQKRIQTMEELWDKLYGTAFLEATKQTFESEPIEVKEEKNVWKEVSEQIPKTYPTTVSEFEFLEEGIKLEEETETEEKFEKVLQSSLDKIRDICIQIYRKIKE